MNPLLLSLKEVAPPKTKQWMIDTLDEDTKLITVEDMLNPDAPKENYLILGILWKIIHSKRDLTENDFNKSGYGANKRAKKPYNRIFMFGGTDGSTFCTIFGEDTTSKKALGDWNQPAIGQLWAIHEPHLPNEQIQLLNHNMPILQPAIMFYPFENKAINVLPEIPMMEPNQSQDAKFFLLHQKKVDFYACALMGPHSLRPPSCTGSTCDRKEPEVLSKACGCFSQSDWGKVDPVVLEYTVTFDGGRNGTVQEVTIAQERSYRTTKLFIRNAPTAGLGLNLMVANKRNKEIRIAVAKCTKFINENGGFTIAITISKGNTKDISDPSATVLSDRSTYRLAYLMPTSLDDILTSTEYKKLTYLVKERFDNPAPNTNNTDSNQTGRNNSTTTNQTNPTPNN